MRVVAETIQQDGFRIMQRSGKSATMIRIDWDNGTLTGASESRKDGIALGY